MQNRPVTRRFGWVGVAAIAAASLLPGGSRAQDADKPADDEAARFVESLYSNRINTVQRTRTSEDDLALMKEMLDIAPTLPEEPDARSALFVRVAGMAERARDGYDLALLALERLAAHNRRHPSAGAAGRLEVYAQWYRGVDRDERKAVAEKYFDELIVAADEALGRGEHTQAKRWYNEAGSVHRVNRLEQEFDLRDKLAQTREVERMQQEVEQLQAAAKGGKMTAEQARRLIVLLALEQGQFEGTDSFAVFMDDPTFAEGLRSAIALGGYDVNDDIADHPPAHSLAAGNWYAGLVDEPGLSDSATRKTMEMARLTLRVFVETTQQETLEKARAAILLRQLDERYVEAYGPKIDESDVIRLLDPDKHLIYGKRFGVKDGELSVSAKSIIHLPVKVKGTYELSLKVRPDKHRVDGLLLVMPIHGKSVRMLIDRSEGHLSRFDGFGAEGNFDESAGQIRLLRDETMSIAVRVDPKPGERAAIRVVINKNKVWEWEGSIEKLDTPSYGLPPDRDTFSLSIWTDAFYESIKLKRIEEKK